MAKVKAAIIGCGSIARHRHIPEYAANPDAEIIGYCDNTRERAMEMAERFGGRVYESVDEVLADPTVNAVSVCVANTQHADITIRALDAGKHVLCEKPMAVTLEQCEAMVEAAERNQRMVMVGQNQRLTRGHQRARQLIREGAIGRVLTFRTTFGHEGPENWSIMGKNTWFFDKKQSAMGAVADLGVHKTDLIQYILDDYVAEVKSVVATLDKKDEDGNPIGVDDNAISIYRMRSGAIGTMTASWTYYGAAEDNNTVIYGTEGVLHIYDHPDYTLYIQKRNGERIYYEMDKLITNELQFSSGVIDEFVSAIVDGRESCISGRDVMMALKAVFASVRSSETGETVVIS